MDRRPQAFSPGAATALELRTRFLEPGALVATAAPTRVTTILGSCIAICIWDPVRGVGGMSHYMLPIHAGRHVASARFGNIAFEMLLERLTASGARKPAMLAHVIGGSCMFPTQGRAKHLGLENADLAFDLLAHESIPLQQVDVGGTRGRKIHFDTHDGTLKVNTL